MATAQFRLGGPRFTRAYLDPVSAKDAVVLQRQYLGGARLTARASETVTLAEALAAIAPHVTAPSENVTLVEALAAIGRPRAAVADAAFSLAESMSSLKVAHVVPAENVALVEQAAAIAHHVTAPGEAVTLAEQLAAHAAHPIALADPALGLADLAAASYVARAAPSENVLLSEQLVVAQHLAIGVGEAVILAEALGAAARRVAALGEGLALAEGMTSVRTAHVAPGEAVTLAEQLAAATSSAVGLVEAITLAEAAASGYVAGVALGEVVPGWGELVATVADHVVAVGEAVALAEQFAAGSAWHAEVWEVVTLAEQVIGDHAMVVWVAESMLLAESLQTIYTPIGGPIMPITILLPAPAGNAAGPWVDVSGMGPQKTIVVAGDCRGSINFEITNALVPEGACPLLTIGKRGSASIQCAARWMRARISGYRGGGAPMVAVSADDTGAAFANLPVLAGNGSGAEADVSTMGLFKTITVSGQFRGTVLLEIGDGTHWSQVLVFTAPGARSLTCGVLRMRATRNGVPKVSPGLPQVDIAGATVYR